MTAADLPRLIHVVSHGPHCLDGVAAAAAIARFYDGIETRVRFSSPSEIDDVIANTPIEAPFEGQELWITDISWTRDETDRLLSDWANRGLDIYWIDHHKTAIDRVERGGVQVPFRDSVVDDRVAASLLVWEYLAGRRDVEGADRPEFREFEPIVKLADDNDRWLHRIEGSRELALTLRAMKGTEAYEDVRNLDSRATYTPRMQEAWDRVAGELERSRALAERTKTVRELDDGTRVVSAVVDGYASEIGDAWGKDMPNTAFAFFDLQGGAVSYRRSPNSSIDLASVAETFGGGGHAAASGCEMPDVVAEIAEAVADRVARAIASGAGRS